MMLLNPLLLLLTILLLVLLLLLVLRLLYSARKGFVLLLVKVCTGSVALPLAFSLLHLGAPS